MSHPNIVIFSELPECVICFIIAKQCLEVYVYKYIYLYIYESIYTYIHTLPVVQILSLTKSYFFNILIYIYI